MGRIGIFRRAAHGSFLSDAQREVAVVGTPISRSRLAGAVIWLGVPARACPPEQLDGAAMVLADRAALNGHPLPRPAVVVRGLSPTDGGPAPVPGPGIALLPSSVLAGTSLLGAFLDAELQVSGEEILADRFPGMPPALSAAFLRQPRAGWYARDFARVLHRSRDALRTWLRDHERDRAQYLRTWYRVESWILLVRHGVHREVADAYLGIGRRANFARSCRRAGITVPWERLRGSGG